MFPCPDSKFQCRPKYPISRDYPSNFVSALGGPGQLRETTHGLGHKPTLPGSRRATHRKQESEIHVYFAIPLQLQMVWRHRIRGFRRRRTVSNSSDRMLLLLQELATLKGGELNLAESQRRREEISREMKELADQKHESEAA